MCAFLDRSIPNSKKKGLVLLFELEVQKALGLCAVFGPRRAACVVCCALVQAPGVSAGLSHVHREFPSPRRHQPSACTWGTLTDGLLKLLFWRTFLLTRLESSFQVPSQGCAPQLGARLTLGP